MPTPRFAKLGVLVAVGMLVSAIGFVASAAPSQARPATGGSGRFGSAINWVEWGATSGETLPNSGFSGTTTQVVGGVSITITCTVSHLASTQVNQSLAFLRVYRSGTLAGDALDDLYNIGGTDTNNQLMSGLANAVYTAKVTFDVACSAQTSAGSAVPLAGLVFGDSEHSGGNEYIAGTPVGPATWRIIDRFRDDACNVEMNALRNGTTNRLQLATGVPPADSCQSGPIAVAFIDGATAMHAEIQGGGISSFSLGVVLASDFGDAPSSYGDAAHLTQFTFSGGEVPANVSTPVSTSSFQLATAAAPVNRLGDYTDPEATPHNSADATGDDVNGNAAFPPSDDEDGLLSSTSLTGVVIGGPYQASVSCYPVGAPVAGWIDWNVDGDFNDPGERSDDATCASGATTLTWPVVPDGLIGKLRGSSTFLRLRVASEAADVAAPTGAGLSGEAEDYELKLAMVPTISLAKVVDGRVAASDQFTVRIADGATTVAASTTAGTDTSSSTGAVLVKPGVAYSVHESLAAGTSTPADYDTELTCTNTITGQPVTTTGSAPNWTLPVLADTDALSCTITNTAHAPALTVAKSASAVIDRNGNGPSAGDFINYSFDVTNTGNVPLTDIAIDEVAFSGRTGNLSAIVCQATTLAPGTSTTCAATYTITQADVDAGRVTNTARALGTPPGTLPRFGSPDDSATVDIDRTAKLSLVKSVTPNDSASFVVGKVLSYSFVVTNTGNVTLDGVAVAETVFSGAGTRPVINCPASAAVPPGGQVVCTATYTVTQADVDAGTVHNEAEATANAPSGAGDPTPATDSVDAPGVQTPALQLEKTVEPNTASKANEQVTWKFALTNTGNLTLTNVHALEDTFSGTGSLGTIDCPTRADPLLPGGTAYCTAIYTTTQADVDAGRVTNTATGQASDPDGAGVAAAPNTAVLILANEPKLSLVKTASPTTATAAGDRVRFSYAIENTGNVTLTNLNLSERVFTGTGGLPLDCPTATLAPGASTTCTADYVVTQDDVDAGGVQNTAVATGIAANGLGAFDSLESTANVTIARQARFSFTKSAFPVDPAKLKVGTVVDYVFVVSNTGNVTLSDVEIAETAFTGKGAAPVVDCPDPKPLAPGEQFLCKSTYKVTQADVDAGRISNTARAGVGVPAGVAAPSPVTDQADLVLLQTTGLKLVKSVAPKRVQAAGEQVIWQFELTNTGNVTLHNARVVEQSFTGAGPLGPVKCPSADVDLAPGGTSPCTATYTVTQADVDAGKVTNTASATALTVANATVAAPPSTAVLEIEQRSSLRLTKTVDPAVAKAVGARVKYTFLVENTGNTMLTDVTVREDSFDGSGQLSKVACPAEANSLAPGATVTCTADYQVTQADVDAGRVTNQASALAGSPQGTVTAPATAAFTVERRPGLSLTKTAIGTLAPGAAITYVFELKNTGNVTLRGVRIVEDEFTGSGPLSSVSCPATASELSPGETAVCSANYVATQADVDSGRLRNSAAARATSPLGPIASGLAVAVVTPPTLPLTGGATGVAGLGLALLLAGAWLIRRRRTA